MIIILNKEIPYLWQLIFSLEKKDFINGVGHRFIQDLKMSLIGHDEYLTEEVKIRGKKQIVWTLDFKHTRLFILLYKKYFKAEFLSQRIQILNG